MEWRRNYYAISRDWRVTHRQLCGFYGTTGTCIPGISTFPCAMTGPGAFRSGSYGVCETLCDGCGRCETAIGPDYQILAAIGQSCGTVDCAGAVICSDASVCMAVPPTCRNNVDCYGSGCVGYRPREEAGCDNSDPPNCWPSAPERLGNCTPRPRKQGGPAPARCPVVSSC